VEPLSLRRLVPDLLSLFAALTASKLYVSRLSVSRRSGLPMDIRVMCFASNRSLPDHAYLG
jgi:hypothetical protein